jgi:hypothetical protein
MVNKANRGSIVAMKSPAGRVERRLAAIPAADVAGYSRLIKRVNDDGVGNIAAIVAIRWAGGSCPCL